MIVCFIGFEVHKELLHSNFNPKFTEIKIITIALQHYEIGVYLDKNMTMNSYFSLLKRISMF